MHGTALTGQPAQNEADGVVIDANVMAQFAQGFTDSSFNDCHDLVGRILTSYGIVVDYNHFIINQWLCAAAESHAPEMFQHWVYRHLHRNNICMVSGSVRSEHRTTMEHHGFRWDKDGCYVECANVTHRRYILTEDPDFYDPQGEREAVRRREGPIATFLEQVLRITVGALCHCNADLQLP